MRFNLVLVCCLLSLTAARTLLNAYSEEAELNQLVAQQAEFEKDIQVIKSGLASTSAKLEAVSKRADRVSLLEEAILKQRQLVFQSSKTLLPPFNLSKCACEELSSSQKQQIINDLNQVRANINTLQNTLKKAPACTRTRQMQEDLLAQLFFIDSIEAVLDSRCRRQAILTPTIWQTNLNSKNWILGDQTLDDVVDEYFKRSVKYENITNCHAQTPFFNGTHCISCPPSAPLFNLYAMRCTHCEEGYKYSGDARSCVESESAAVCTDNQFYVESTNKCVDLVSCSPGTLLDKTTNTCRAKKCAQGFEINKHSGQCQQIDCANNFFNPNTLQCEVYQTCADTFLNKEKNKCEPFAECDPAVMFLNRTINVCMSYVKCPDRFLNKHTNECEDRARCEPQDFYVEETNNCKPRVKCADGEFYNNFTNKCEDYVACPQGFLNKILNKCEPFEECGDKFLNKETNICEAVAECDHSKFYNNKINRCEDFIECPQFLDKTTNTCHDFVSCAPNEQINKQTNGCKPRVISCEPDEVLNLDTGKCVKKPTIYRPASGAVNYTEGKITWKTYLEGIEKAIQANPQAQVVECPSDKAYSLIDKCVGCETGRFFLDTHNCEECKKGYEYEPQSKTCKIVLYLTNIEAGNVDLQGISMDEYKGYVQGIIDKNPKAIVKHCSEQEPYSAEGQQCTSCPADKPLFDVVKQGCSKCEAGKSYSKERHLCE